MNNDLQQSILKELKMLRKLKIFELTQQGASQSQLAQALGVSQPTISRMLPRADSKKKTENE